MRSRAGSAIYRGRDLLAHGAGGAGARGLFLAFQYPVEIPGVNNMYFLRSAHQCASAGTAASPSSMPAEFLNIVRAKLKLAGY